MEEQRSFDEKREFWEKCSTFPDYEVSTKGRVRRSPKSKSMPGQIMKSHLSKQNRLWIMLRNEYSQQVRVDIAELVAEAFLGHIPSKTSIIFVEDTKDPSANNLRVYLVDDAAPIHVSEDTAVHWDTYEEADPIADIEHSLGATSQRIKDIQEGE
jgi:hypothetical protein